MWARLDDALIDHQKIFEAGDLLGKNGPGLALALYAVGLMYCNKHLTDGFLSDAVIKNFRHVEDPLRVAGALTKVALFEKVVGGFRVHDFAEYNPSARDVKHKRKEDRRRKAEARAGKNGN